MNSSDPDIWQKVERFSKEDRRLKRLYEEHKDLDRKLLKLGKKPLLTPAEQREERELKRKKLAGKDAIMRILEDHESSV